jgi:hypothetical protein
MWMGRRRTTLHAPALARPTNGDALVTRPAARLCAWVSSAPAGPLTRWNRCRRRNSVGTRPVPHESHGCRGGGLLVRPCAWVSASSAPAGPLTRWNRCRRRNSVGTRPVPHESHGCRGGGLLVRPCAWVSASSAPAGPLTRWNRCRRRNSVGTRPVPHESHGCRGGGLLAPQTAPFQS